MNPRIIYSNGEEILWDGPMYDPFPDTKSKDDKNKEKRNERSTDSNSTKQGLDKPTIKSTTD